MTPHIETAINIYPAFTCDEDQMMKDIDEMLGEFITSVEYLGEDRALISLTTGEVVRMDELRKVRGILEALYNTACWTVED